MDTTRTSDGSPETNQPGLGVLREAVRNQSQRQRPNRASLLQDAVAGLNSAISSVPDGMADSLLAGVNPIYGLYAAMAGPLVGGIFSSTQLMVISSTSAASLVAGQALANLQAEARNHALFTMVILAGAFQVLLGLLGMGRLSRFVSYSVMTGFLTGIAILLVLSQLPTVTGYTAAGSNKIMQALNLLANADKINLLSLGLAVLTLALAVALPHTRLGNFGSLVAISVPSVLVALFHLESVRTVRGAGNIPPGLPTLYLPSFSDMTGDVLTGALALAVVILVQGAGVSQSATNPDGSRSSASRDFIAQGAANIASGLIRGIPVGGSLNATALNVMVGAGTRWAPIFAGMWMMVIVVIFPGLVSSIAMPALGALLILAGLRSIHVTDILLVWRSGWPARLAGLITLLLTLFLPIQAAVGIGVVFSALLYIGQSSADISVVEQVERPDGRIQERRPARQLAANRITVLDVYGPLSYAGARTLERLLPTPRNTMNPVVILRLRDHPTFGATLIDVLSNYADRLQAANGRLYLTGLSEHAHEQLMGSGKLQLTGPVQVFHLTPIVGESTRAAYSDAQAWLLSLRPSPSPNQAPSNDAQG